MQGAGWLSPGVYKLSKNLVASSVYQVSVGWREICHVPKTQQILGATVQNEATWAALSWSLTGASRNVGKWVRFISIDSSRLIVVVLCFTGVNRLLVERTDLFQWQYVASRDEGPSSVCYITMPGTLLVLVLTVHMLHDVEGHWRFAQLVYSWAHPHAFFLQWHLVSFPHKLRGGTCGDKCGPLQDVHPVSKGRICVVGTEDCLVLRNHSQRLRKGGTLRCPSFWQLGESQTLYKKSGNVCVPDLNVLPWNISPATTGRGNASSVFTISGVCGWNFCLGMWSLTLCCVFSKSLSYTVSLFRQFCCR